MTHVSKSQIDRLGERLRCETISDDDLREMDRYRRSFNEAYDIVISAIQAKLTLLPTGRKKTNSSIIAKLKRLPTIGLTQMQDIVGCRMIVSNVLEQDDIVEKLCAIFPQSQVKDRRVRPSFGYRAVHVIAKVAGRPVEIQIRTEWQHLWAALSENLSDIIDPQIKYGGGPDELCERLKTFSSVIQQIEASDVLKQQLAVQFTKLVNDTETIKQNRNRGSHDLSH